VAIWVQLPTGRQKDKPKFQSTPFSWGANQQFIQRDTSYNVKICPFTKYHSYPKT